MHGKNYLELYRLKIKICPRGIKLKYKSSNVDTWNFFQKDILKFSQVGKLAPHLRTNQYRKSIIRLTFGVETAYVEK